MPKLEHQAWTGSAIHHFDTGTFEGGRVVANQKNGWGTFYYKDGPKDGQKYEGYWKDDKYHGYGTLWSKDRLKSQEGEWTCGRLNGRGSTYAPNGAKDYEGDFVMGKKEGFGNIFDPIEGKKIYKGQLRLDVKWGKGKLYDSSENLVYQGEFFRFHFFYLLSVMWGAVGRGSNSWPSPYSPQIKNIRSL